jgi:hypothetical protein
MIELFYAVVLLAAIGESGTASVTPASECIATSPGTTAAIETDGEWFIVHGGTKLSGFGENRSQAHRALEIIKHYGMNERCVAGSPTLGLQYWLVDGRSPVGAIKGETCFSFDPRRMKVAESDESWKIVEGSSQVFNFRSEATARAAYAAIQTHRFSHACFVGRPEPKFLYMRR